MKVLAGLKGGALSVSLAPEVRSQLLSATGAIRAIISKLNTDDENSRQNNNINEFIALFRREDNLDIISVLTFGARSDNYEARSNSILILANVVDNSTVCVPLDHLWDPNIGKPDGEKDYPVRGRANLLGVVSVVAPWAYRENYENIKRVKDEIFNKRIDRSDVNLKQTIDILNNIQVRLDSQTNSTNRTVPLPAELKRECAAYVPRFATKEQLKY
jgi:hypothetical protein